MTDRGPHDSNAIRIERTFRAPAQAVFEAWTSAEMLRRWYPPGADWETPVAEVDLRIGGKLRLVMRSPSGEEFGGWGEYREITPPTRLVFTWEWDRPDAGIRFNATSNDDVQGTALVDIAFDDFMRPVTKSVTAHFAIATAVARHMSARGGGVILVMAGGREAIPDLGGSHVAWAALAGLCRQLAAELGPQGIRVAWLLSPGSPGSDEHGPDPDTAALLLDRRPSYNDVANIAVFAASDWAATMTATEINLTAGAVID